MSDIPRIIENAGEWLMHSLGSADGSVLLTSPFIAPDVCRQIVMAMGNTDNSITVITSLDPSAVANGYMSVKGIRALRQAGIEVRHSERLHAKCFLVGSKGILGSGNLTGAGLGTTPVPNRELGVELSSAQVQEARGAIEKWPSKIIVESDLKLLLEAASKIARTTPSNTTLDSMSALLLAERLLTDARDPARSLWLKLEYGDPQLGGWKEESWIASPKKGKPSFRPGDLVIICAKETHDCYAVVEISSEPEFRPDDYVNLLADHAAEDSERWPWVNRTIPRLVPEELLNLKLRELDVSGQGLQNGHVRLQLDQFAMAVRNLSRLVTPS